jgi:hypothetical protein
LQNKPELRLGKAAEWNKRSLTKDLETEILCYKNIIKNTGRYFFCRGVTDIVSI